MNGFRIVRLLGNWNGLVRPAVTCGLVTGVLSAGLSAEHAAAQEPSAWRGTWQMCVHGGPAQYCVGSDGTQVCAGMGGQVCVNRPWPWENRPATVSAGVDGTTPAYPYGAAGVAATGSAMYNLHNGNVDLSGGAFLGVPNALGVSVQRQWSYDRELDRQIRDAQAAAQRGNPLPAQPVDTYQRPAAPRDAMPQEWRRDIGQYAYNPPADFAAPRQDAPAMRPPTVPSDYPAPLSTSPGLSQQDFRAQLVQNMRDFNAIATARAQQLSNDRAQMPSAQPSNSAPSLDYPVMPSRPSALVMPRNNDIPGSTYRIGNSDGVRYYDQAGNRLAGTPQSDMDPGMAQPGARQNMVYNAYTGEQRPIGRVEPSVATAQPDQANRPISTSRFGYDDYAPRGGQTAAAARPGTQRSQYDDQGFRTDSTRRTYDAQGYRTDSALAGNAPNNQGQPVRQPQLPAVNQRQPGAQSPTASLRFSN